MEEAVVVVIRTERLGLIEEARHKGRDGWVGNKKVLSQDR